MTIFSVPGTFGSDSRPARVADGRKLWFKDPSTPLADNGTRVDATWANDIVGMLRALMTAAGITPGDGDDDALADAIVALIGATTTDNAHLAAMAANTVKANITGGSAHPTDVSLASLKTWLALAISDTTGLQAALDLKAPLASPALTGTPTSPTAAPGTNTTRIATTEFVTAAITALIGGSPGALDTLKELADAINDDASFAATITTALGYRLRFDASQSLSGGQVTQAQTNLGMTAIGQSVAQAANAAAVTALLSAFTGDSGAGGVKGLVPAPGAGAAAAFKYLHANGTFQQVAFSDISGTIAAGQLPAPTASTLGGVKSLANVANKWINSIGTDGVPTQTQPAYSNLSGNPSAAALAGAAVGPFTDIASATTTDLSTVATIGARITGTTTITGFGTGANLWRIIKFAGILVLTHNATSLILPNAGSNITTAAGDTCEALSDGSGNWTVFNYQRAAGSPLSGSVLTSQLVGLIVEPQVRLTLTSGLKRLISSVSAATTVYATPCGGNLMPYYDATNWGITTFTEQSLALDSNSGHTGYHQSGKNFDLWYAYVSGSFYFGTGPAWSGDTTIGTGAGTSERELKNGVLTNKVSMTLRFGSASGNTVTVPANQAVLLGTMRATADGQTGYIFGALAAGGTAASFGLCNLFNRVDETTLIQESADSWTYNSATVRAANASNTMRCSFIQCVQEDAVLARYYAMAQGLSSGDGGLAGIGLNATNAFSGVHTWGVIPLSGSVNFLSAPIGAYNGRLLGWNFVQACEANAGAATVTYYGDNGAPNSYQNGLEVLLKF